MGESLTVDNRFVKPNRFSLFEVLRSVVVRTRQGVSLTEDVYVELRRAVMHGQLQPGSRLHLSDLAAEHDVSLGVIREAVTRLASERLLDAMPQSGFRVRAISISHLRDLVEARCAIERIVVMESVRHGDTDWEAALVGAHHALTVRPLTIKGSASAEWINAHRAFHVALSSACPNETLRGIRSQLFDEAELYRQWSAPSLESDRNVTSEHSDLLAEALAHNAKRAGDLIVEHLRHTARLAEQFATEATVAPTAR
jgi:DNA-binding GntR family transcriptional regulator